MNSSSHLLNRARPTSTLADIKRITSLGIVYTDADGELHFIDFAICVLNGLAQKAETAGIAQQAQDNCVGEHNVCAIPPYIEFFTQPRTRFEFSFVSPCETRDDRYFWLSEWIHKAGWATVDRS